MIGSALEPPTPVDRQPEARTGHHRGGPAADERPDAPAGAVVAAGVALALLVGRDGSPGWQVLRVVAVVVLTAAAVAALARLGARARGWLAAGIGVVVLAVGAGFLPYAVKDGLSLAGVAGVIAVLAGVVLTVTGTLARTRGCRPLRRVGGGIGAVASAVLVAVVVGPAVAATNVPRPQIGATPESRGLAYESVTVTTGDGVELAGWYTASTNGAAVVLLHGAGSTRSNVLNEAAVLSRNGFGVLMIDARGHGESSGRAMDFGWHGDADIAAATGFLADRTDVDPERIGVVGSSMGGEQALGASGSNELIRAVVAEGATARTAADEAWLSDEYGWRGLFQEQLEHAQDWVTDVLTSASVPISGRRAVAASRSTRYLLITAGDVANEGHAAAYVAAAAPDRVVIWNVEGAGHTDGLQVAPEEWEQRVVAFLGDALDVPIENAP